MPIIILGMHRSGTSMVTRLLHKCGLYLGETEELMLPDSEDNPEGYWEHTSISKLNDEILHHFGGSWRNPPQLLPGWSINPSLQSFWDRFESITAHYYSHRHWGWKDPRNSLTLEFWLTRIPDLKVILCLRNPVEVADSLSTGKPMRDLDRSAALDLWAAYHRMILQQDIGDRLIITHYDSYSYNPDAELRRVLKVLDIQASANQIEEALSTINPSSKRQHAPDIFLLEHSELDEVNQQYALLCLRAGDIFEKLRADTTYLLNSTVTYTRRLHNVVAQLNEKIKQQNQKLVDYRRLTEQQGNSIAAQAKSIEQQHKMIGDLEARLIVFRNKISLLGRLSSVALQGFKYRSLQRSRIMAVAEKINNFWTIRKVTHAVRTAQLREPALFDAQWYLEQYPEVSKAGMHPYVHFRLFGWYQGYRPMPLFDTEWYVTNYPYFNDGWANPLEHYEQAGQYNGCRPCEQFDPQWYLSQYRDVKDAGIDPLYHYYFVGSYEGRRPSPEVERTGATN